MEAFQNKQFSGDGEFTKRASAELENIFNKAVSDYTEGLGKNDKEIEEELGLLPDIKKTVPLETFISSDEHFHFHTYLCVIDKEFIPKLNEEHNGYAWVNFGSWPKPLHNGLANTLRSKTNQQKLETVIKLVDIIA